MKAIATRYEAVDPYGVTHEFWSYEAQEVKFALFGKLKSHKGFSLIASAQNEDGASDAYATKKSQWRAGAEFAIAEASK